MKNMSLLAKIMILLGFVAAVSAVVAVFVTKFSKKRDDNCNDNKCCDDNDEALKDFEECCNACYSDCTDDN